MTRQSLNPERDAEILRRWELGEKSGVIAEALRVTRNTILGVVCRAGKQRGDKTNAAQREGGRKAAVRMANRTVTMRAIKSRQRERAIVQAQAIEAPPASLEPIPIGQRCTIMDLTDSKCRWPIGDPGQPDFSFCGGRALSGVPYCGFHTRVAYQPRPK